MHPNHDTGWCCHAPLSHHMHKVQHKHISFLFFGTTSFITWRIESPAEDASACELAHAPLRPYTAERREIKGRDICLCWIWLSKAADERIWGSDHAQGSALSQKAAMETSAARESWRLLRLLLFVLFVGETDRHVYWDSDTDFEAPLFGSSSESKHVLSVLYPAHQES